MANTAYNEHIEEYSTLSELQAEANDLINKFRQVGNLDVELSIDLLSLTITVLSPKESDDS